MSSRATVHVEGMAPESPAPPAAPPSGTSSLIPRAILVTASALVAALVCGAVWSSRPARLDVRTDIVGYPTLTGFDPRPSTWGYYLIVIAFPLLTLGVYAVLARFFARFLGPGAEVRRSRPSPAEVSSDAASPNWKMWTVAIFRPALVGATFGWQVSIATRAASRTVVTVVVAVAYVAVVAGAARLVKSFSGNTATPRQRLATCNALATPLLVFGIYAISQNTQVTVLSDHSVHHFSWFPLWLAIVLAAGAEALVWRGLRRRGTDPIGVERWAMLLVAGPVLVFLAFAAIQGAAGNMDVFETGQWLVGARYMTDGALPYRDFVAIHGPLLDGLVAMVGPFVVQNTFWGVLVGLSLLVAPLYWVLLYLLNVYLYRKNVVFLVSTVLVVLAGATLWKGLMAQTNFRMLFVPLVLLALAWLLTKPTRFRAYLLVGLALLHAFLTPEFALAIPGVVIVLVVFEYHHWDRAGVPARSAFRRVILCAEASVVLVGAAAIVLGSTGVLRPMIEHFTTFSSGHSLTGAFPVPREEPTFHTARILLPVLLVASFAFMAVRIRSRRPLELADWVMSADAIFVVLYYPKFFGRPDAGHFFEVWTLAVPLVFYVVYRVLDAGERVLNSTHWGAVASRYTTRHLLTLVVAVAVLAPGLSTVRDQFVNSAARFDTTVHSEPKVPALGYSSARVPNLLSDVKAIVAAVTPRNDQVFDFTNAPGLFYYTLGYDSPTRYYHVSTAIRSDTQADLIGELRRANPVLVAYEGGPGLNGWDGIPNSVRHYDVSDYILRHYRPLVRVDGLVMMVRNDVQVPTDDLARLPLAGPVSFDNLYASTAACPWGVVADFSDQHPSATAPSRALAFKTVRNPDGSYRAVVDRPIDSQRFRWLEVTTDGSFAPDQFVVSSTGDATRSVTFATDARSPRHYLVQVGACAQWWGFGANTFVIDHQRAQHIRSIRVIE